MNDKIKNTPIGEIGLDFMTLQCLKNIDILTVGEVAELIQVEEDFLKIPNLGKLKYKSLYLALENAGVDLFLKHSIDEEIFVDLIEKDITILAISEVIVNKLHNNQIFKIYELMKSLITHEDAEKIGLHKAEVMEIAAALNAKELRLGIIAAPISNLGFFDDIRNKIYAKYSSIQSILKAGFTGLVDELEAEDAIRVAKKLRKAGYLIDGYPWNGNAESCKKLRHYLRRLPIESLKLSEESKARLNLVFGEKGNLDRLSRRSANFLYGVLQNYDECVSIALQLKEMYFPMNRPANILDCSKEEFLSNETLRNTALEELDLSLVIIQILKKHGIKTVDNLLAVTAEELYKKSIAKDSALSSIRSTLHEGKLLLKGDYVIRCEHCGNFYVSDDATNHLCQECISRLKRISKAADIQVTLHGPEYSSFTNLSSGFILYAHIKNNSKKVQTVKLIDFYVVEDEKQKAPKYFLTGYSFDKETIIPDTVRAVGKIWDAKEFEYESFLPSDTYAILSIKVEGENNNRVYKFVNERSKDKGWKLFDFYKF